MRSLVVLLTLVVAAGSAAAKPVHRKAPVHKKVVAKHKRVALHDAVRGQSVGAPWDGQLQSPSRLPEGDGYHIRRPWRSFGTERTVELVQRAITDTIEAFPDKHVLAIGDLSAEHGGQITEHHSHQSGRDADIGLYYKEKPASYPASFVAATEDNLDCAATWGLISAFVAEAGEDGGVQVMFLDFKVQGILYRWALEHDVSEAHLEHVFQFPHGRGASAGMIRHEPNHDNHLHVRFKCPSGDTSCR